MVKKVAKVKFISIIGMNEPLSMVNLVQRRGESAVVTAAVQKSSSGLIFSLRGVSCLNISTKNKYSILKYISSLIVLYNQNNIVAWV